jgi:hypothetical protein
MRYTEATTNFAGGVNDSAAATAFGDTEVSAIVNGRIMPDGTVRTRGGSQRLHSSTLTGQGYGGTRFTTANGTVQWLAFVGSRLLRSTDNGRTWTETATSLREDYWSLTTISVGGDNYLYAANGGTNVYSWDGTTWGAEGSFPAGVKYLCTFNERIYYAGHDGNEVVGTAIGDPTDHTAPDAVILQIQTHDGDNAITGLYQFGSNLLVFKRNSTNIVDGYGNSDIIVAAGAKGISRSVGCVAFRTIVAADSMGVLWLSERGVELYSGGQIQLLSGRVRRFTESVSWASIIEASGVPVAVYVPRMHIYRCSIPTGYDRNNRIMDVHMASGGAVSFSQHASATEYSLAVEDGVLRLKDGSGYQMARVSNGVLRVAEFGQSGVSPTLRGNVLDVSASDYDHAVLFSADVGDNNDECISIGYDGFVRRMDYGTTDDAEMDTDNGDAIDFRLRTRPMLFGKPLHQKWVRQVETLVSADSASTITTYIVAGGAISTGISSTVGVSTNGQPDRVKVRTSSRGETPQVEIRSNDIVSIAAIGCSADIIVRSAA